MRDSSNPYASPSDDARPEGPVFEELKGRMPASVKWAIGLVAAITVAMLLLAGFCLVESDIGLSMFYLLLASAGGGLIRVYFSRSRNAFRWTNWLGTLAGVAALLGLCLAGSSITRYFARLAPSGEHFIFTPEAILIIELAVLGVVTTLCLLLTAARFAIRRPTARHYFNLLCLNCQRSKVQAADWRFTRTRCKACSAVW